MFSNIGPFEILVIAVIALLVVGPERLPSAVRTGSLWVGRFRRNFYKIKSEIERELNADEIKRQLHNESVMADLNEAKKQVTDFAKDTEKSVHETLDLEEEKKQRSAVIADTGIGEEQDKSNEIQQSTSGIQEVKSDVKKFHQNIKKDLSWKDSENLENADGAPKNDAN